MMSNSDGAPGVYDGGRDGVGGDGGAAVGVGGVGVGGGGVGRDGRDGHHDDGDRRPRGQVHGEDNDRDDDDAVAFASNAASSAASVSIRHYGPDNLFGYDEDADMQRAACRQLDDAIALLSPGDRSSFARARESSPHLIWEESNPIRYLQFESFNPWAAARRLTMYWTIREEVFGPERAFRPLDLYDDEAFGVEDPVGSYFDSDAVVLLPPDNEGRVALFIDRSKIVRPDEVRLRSLFAVFQMLSTNAASSRYVVLIKFENPLDAKFSMTEARMLSNLVLNGLPIRRERVHVICRTPSSDGRGASAGRMGPRDAVRAFLDYVVPLALRRLNQYFGRAPIVVHVVASGEEVLSALRPYGWKREGLPRFLGGIWDHRGWFERYYPSRPPPSGGGTGRGGAIMEGAAAAARNAGSTNNEPEPAPIHPRDHSAVRAAAGSRKDGAGGSSSSGGERTVGSDLTDLVRRTLADYARGLARTVSSSAAAAAAASGTGRRAIPDSIVADENDDAEKKKTNARGAADAAKPGADGGGGGRQGGGATTTRKRRTGAAKKKNGDDGEDETDRKRRMFAFYARRRRGREKVRNEEMERRYSDLTMEQARLRAENRRLRSLLDSAVSLVERHGKAGEIAGEPIRGRRGR